MKIHTGMFTNGSEVIIHFIDGESDAYSPRNDAGYHRSRALKTPIFYTLSSDNKKLKINTMNHSGDKTVALVANVSVAGTYTIDFDFPNNYTPYNCISLEDTYTGKMYSLDANDAYTFTENNTGTERTFLVHFRNSTPEECSKLASESLNTLGNSTFITPAEDGVFVSFNFDEEQSVTLSVFNLLGQQVVEDISLVTAHDKVKVTLPANNQVYLIRIQTADEAITKKVTY
jgi:hypothetical protein